MLDGRREGKPTLKMFLQALSPPPPSPLRPPLLETPTQSSRLIVGVHTINVLGYHSSHEARSRMKSVGLLRMRDDLIRRCLFHPDSAAWDKVSALSQVKPLSLILSFEFVMSFAD